MKSIKQRGFTCIELALAGAILGGIVAALLPAVQ
jgi:type II secretory pathway pseudopilin PulG